MLPEELAHLNPYLEEYGYAAVFGCLLFESFGFPLPGESLLIATSALASEGTLDIVPLVVAAWTAAVIGDNIGYAIGRFGGRVLILRYGRRLGITDSRFARVEGVFAKYGGGVVVTARFFDILRQLNGLAAGTIGMRWWRFVVYNALGGALWVGVWGLGVYYFGDQLKVVLPWIHRFGYAMLGVGALVVVALVTTWLIARRRKRGAPTAAE